MALALGDLLTAARDRHPLFHRTRVPDAVGARFLTGFQRQLLAKIAETNPELVAQQASVAFAATPENAVGVVGAGTSGGLPAGLVGGQPVELELPAGSALEMDFDGAQVLVPASVVGSATATSLTKPGAGWTVDQWAGKYTWLPAGPGVGQRRAVLSNTADTIVISTGSDGQEWATLPVAGETMFEVVDPFVELTQEVGVITALPAESQRVGYLVRLNAQGLPYIDLARPLLATFDVGIDLPPHEYLLGGAVRFESGDQTDLELRRYQQRWTLGAGGYGAYVMNGQLFLIGGRTVWGGVAAFDLRYVPIAPALTALTDYLLLPDSAYAVLVARLAELFANRVNGLPDAPKIDVGRLTAAADEAEGVFLESVGRTARAFPQYVREVW